VQSYVRAELCIRLIAGQLILPAASPSPPSVAVQQSIPMAMAVVIVVVAMAVVAIHWPFAVIVAHRRRARRFAHRTAALPTACASACGFVLFGLFNVAGGQRFARRHCVHREAQAHAKHRLLTHHCTHAHNRRTRSTVRSAGQKKDGTRRGQTRSHESARAGMSVCVAIGEDETIRRFIY
jgi:hypothetical protein